MNEQEKEDKQDWGDGIEDNDSVYWESTLGGPDDDFFEGIDTNSESDDYPIFTYEDSCEENNEAEESDFEESRIVQLESTLASILIKATTSGCKDLVGFIISCGVSPNSCGISGQAAIAIAAEHDDIDTCKILLRNGANVSHGVDCNITALNVVLRHPDFKVAPLIFAAYICDLIKSSNGVFDLNMPVMPSTEKYGSDTMLGWAARFNLPYEAVQLLELGANPYGIYSDNEEDADFDDPEKSEGQWLPSGDPLAIAYKYRNKEVAFILSLWRAKHPVKQSLINHFGPSFFDRTELNQNIFSWLSRNPDVIEVETLTLDFDGDDVPF